MPYVSYAKQRKEKRDIKITNHPHKSQAEKDEALKRIVQRGGTAIAGGTGKPKKRGKSNLQRNP